MLFFDLKKLKKKIKKTWYNNKMKIKKRLNVYDAFMFPLEAFALRKLRCALIPKATGDVLEIGAGTGVNLAYYKDENIKSLTIADKEVGRVLQETALPGTCQRIDADVLNLPFEDGSFDTVVETLLLCSVDDVPAALTEIKRVLKSNGRFIHIDHGLPKKSAIKRVFLKLAPLWHKMSQSCQIDKTYEPYFEQVRFKTNEQGYTKTGVFYWGISTKP